MKIVFGCDHGGFTVKEEVFKYFSEKNYDVKDFGTFSSDSCDYPDIAEAVSEYLASGQADFGVLICGTGIGMSISANKVKGIRCAHVHDLFSAEMTRRHNDSNIIALGARISSANDIVAFIDKFLNTPFDGGRHAVRVEKIDKIENKYFK